MSTVTKKKIRCAVQPLPQNLGEVSIFGYCQIKSQTQIRIPKPPHYFFNDCVSFFNWHTDRTGHESVKKFSKKEYGWRSENGCKPLNI